MSMTKEEILDAAKDLDLDDRMDLVDGLLASVGPEEQLGIDKAWIEVAEERLGELQRGEAEAIDGEEALDRLRAKYVKQ